MKKKVLFICVENSCRSQMAEAMARILGQGDLEAFSAGSKPSGEVNPSAIQVMREKGIDLSGHRSKGPEAFPFTSFDYVITMGCGDACSTVPTKERLDWPIPDPKGKGLEDFRKVRDQIEAKVRDLLAEG